MGVRYYQPKSLIRALFNGYGRPNSLLLVAAILLMTLSLTRRSGAQIAVDPNSEGNTQGSGCSLQEAIYATEFGTNVALNQTDDDTTYYTACSDPSGAWNVIDLPGGTLKFTQFWDGDSHNPFGPTATPIIFKAITIRGHGTTLQYAWTAASPTPGNFRLFAVGQATIPYNGQPLRGVIGGSYSGTGNLTLQDVYIKGFKVKGGNGGNGAGGGLGAGGAIYVGKISTGVPALTVENSTFDSNSATGGNGTESATCCGGGGGGGGINGNGGNSNGGGGGARGDGGDGPGAGGGGTVFSGNVPSGGYLCGGLGASFQLNGAQDGHDATCPGGGGGGADNDNNIDPFQKVHGGDGAYGGGGAGAFNSPEDNGGAGNGGFGAGGGYAFFCIGQCSGDGGFGGGGGGSDGHGGFFGGKGGDLVDTDSAGGGGGALGGAIFNDNGTLTIKNSTFTKNKVSAGSGAGGTAGDGRASGGAIFSRDGFVTIENSTVSGNQAIAASVQTTPTGGGIEVFGDSGTTVFGLANTIVANNGTQECISEGPGTILPGGKNNLIMDNDGCPSTGLVTSDPMLSGLNLNAPGDTPTMALQSGSPAIGAADSGTSLSADQRGVTRKAAPDIGAYETLPEADLQITKSVSSSTAKAGDVVTYTLTITNLGPNDASGVTITDSLPAELIFSSCTATAGGTCSSQGGTFSTLAANATGTITIAGALVSGLTRGTVVTNTASVQASSPDDPVSTNNTSSVSFTVIVPDFTLSAVTPITIAVGSSGTSTITVGSVDTFSSAVSLSTTGPSNFHRSFNPNPVTPPSNGSTTSTLTVSLEPSVVAGSYNVNETGTSGNLSHEASVVVKVQTTIAGTANVISGDLKLGAIDNAGIATALTSKLSVAQSSQTAGQIQTEINTLQALLSQMNAQSGKHIKTSWLDGTGQLYNPAGVLIGDVTDLLVNAGANLQADPITGSVVNTNGQGVSGITVNLLNSRNTPVASATTDVTGFYYFPATSGLSAGSSYTVKVTVPKIYRNASPSSQSFTWKSAAVSLNSVVLN